MCQDILNMHMAKTPTRRERTTEETWLNAAYDVLTKNGVEAVKVMPLAEKLGLTRTGFYWHFKNREALLEAMIQRWEDKNTGNLVAQTEAYAESICEAMFNLFDCWIDNTLFDSRLDLAIRNWARNDPKLQIRLNQADATRSAAIAAMFKRFGYSDDQALARSMTVVYTQIGYISMQVSEDWEARIAKMPDYIEVSTGVAPSVSEVTRFQARHRMQQKNR